MSSLVDHHWLLLLDYLRAGGPVMVPLVVVSVVMWLLIAERLLFLRRLYRRNMPLRTPRSTCTAGRLPDPRQYSGAVAILVNRFLAVPAPAMSRLDRFILEESVQRLNHSLTDRLAVIGVLAAVAPLLGLLGTVTGMIATFEVLAVFGTGNAKAMAGGISEALITTQTGLLVAIPGLVHEGFSRPRGPQPQQRITAAGL
ncbi:MAG: MotA/TolQ/ExbB proton channel family protein [Desulfobacterales bacterium]|nr:MotA/TolQ/ExbB proton channel family protein [Desulfobacterales bacterium]